METANNALSERLQHWIVNAVHPDAAIVSVQQLHGGITSLLHSITLAVHGREQAVVLRQFNNPDWVRSVPDLAVREAESLRRAARAGGIQVPEVVAYDMTGNECGVPAVLMTRLAGEVLLLPQDQESWLDSMARSLARIHTVEAEGFPWSFAPYFDAASLDTSSWSRVPELWQAAAAIVKEAVPVFTPRFIHRDYHPANLLSLHGQVSGVVDWVNGCVGPAGLDVGHCRVNLAQLHHVGVADEFLAAYLRYSGSAFTYDPYWDLVALIDFAYWPPDVYGGWTALGVTGLTKDMMGERLDSYLLSIMDRTADKTA